MINELSEQRKKDLYYYIKLSIRIKYLPEIMQYIKEKTPDRTEKEIASKMLNFSNIRLSQKAKEKIKDILASSFEKGMTYKTYKNEKKLKLKRKGKENKYYMDKDEIELFLLYNPVLTKVFNLLKIEGIEKESTLLAKEYIEPMLNEREKQIARRKK